jgi:DivIVA domain-containing protein
MVRRMPDQSSASTEHALMQEITAPLATLPDDPVPIAASVEFPTALRGYDRIAVDAYVQKTSQLVAEMQATRSPESAVRRALARVGEEVSGILQRAHETAAQITAQSRSEAEDRLEAARHEAAQIIAAAEARVRELDAETDRIWAERHRIVEDTRGLARELLALTETAAGRFPADDSAEADATVDAAPGEGDVGADAAPGEGDVDVDAAPGEGDVGADAAPGEGGSDVAAPEPFSMRDEGDEATHHDRDEATHHDEDPDIESTAILPTVEPPGGDEERA